MRITVVGMIKNSADIIETFIRANGLYADNFVLIDNDSTDNTRKILDSLKNLGYDIEVLYDSENAYLQSMKTNILIRKAIEMTDPDWIVILDDDEILVSEDERSVREVISGWDKNQAYYARWRVYVPTEEDDDNEVCVAKRMKYCFLDECAAYSYFKVMVSGKTAADPTFRIAQGNHDFIGPSVPKIKQNELVIAHYPVRSKEQIIAKALVGWTNILAMPYRFQNNGEIWHIIYDQVKHSFDLSMDQLWEVCMHYVDISNPEAITVANRPLNVEEKALDIRFTSKNEIDPLSNYFANTEKLAEAYKNLLKEKMDNVGE